MKRSIYFLSIYIFVIILVCSCSSLDRTVQSPCFDGWTMDNTGRSVVWIPPNETMKLIQQKLPLNRVVVCFHKMPNGKLIVVNYFDRKYATSFRLIGDNYEIIDEEIIVTGHN